MKKLLFLIAFSILFFATADTTWAATLYLKAAGGNCTAAGTWSNTGSGGGDSSGPPTAADDAIAETGSGGLTIDSGCVMRSFDTTSGTGSYGGTITHTAGVNWTIGDGTAGAGNVAIKLNSGMTAYTLGNARTSAIVFVSTSGTQQTVEFGTKAHGDLTFQGAGSSYIFSSNTTATGALVTHTAGTLDMNAKTMSWLSVNTTGNTARTFTGTNADITCNGGGGSSWQASGSNLTLTMTGSTLRFPSNVTMVMGNGYTYGSAVFTGTGAQTLSGISTIVNVTRTAGAVKSATLNIGSAMTITGTLTITGNSATERILLQSTTLGVQRTITNTGATMAWSNVDVQDISLTTAYDASAITGLSGNAGGNNNITFTATTTKYWVGNGGNWNDPTNHWATASGGSPAAANFPLPQDNVVFDASSFSSGSQTVSTNGVPRLGYAISWTGVTNTPAFSIATANVTNYGSTTLSSGMTLSRPSVTWIFEGRGSANLTTAGLNFGAAITVQPVGGSLTLQDGLTINSSITVVAGTFDTNGMAVSSTAFSSTNNNTRTVTLGASTITLTGTGTVWNTSNATGLTFNANTSTIVINETTQATSKTLAAATSQTFNNLTFSGKNIIVTCTTGMTINTLALNNLGDTTGVSLQASRTYTVSNFTTTASSGNVAKLISGTAGTAATLSKSSGTISVDWISIKDSAATGGASWYAGANSTDVSGNSGWIFTAPPAVSTGEEYIIISTG